MLPPDDPRIKDLLRRARQIELVHERQSDLTLELIDEIKRLIGGGGGLGPEPSDSKDTEKGKELNKGREKKMMMNSEEEVANSLEIKEDSGGKYLFSFDSRPFFTLSPQQADLLIFLATAKAGKPSPADGLTGWRTREEILKHLQRSSNKQRLSGGSVSTSVNKLKSAVLKWDGHLLVRSHARGHRLALRRGNIRGLDKTSATEWL